MPHLEHSLFYFISNSCKVCGWAQTAEIGKNIPKDVEKGSLRDVEEINIPPE
jgi:hypothetical protein